MSTFGQIFRVTTFGESHGAAVGCVIDGCPPGMSLCESDIQPAMLRRRPGLSLHTSSRQEPDATQILSGTERGTTLGTPIALLVWNQDARPNDYHCMGAIAFPRPSHADLTYLLKYGLKAASGGGRSSARETVGRVAAGAVAEKHLRESHGVEIVAFVSSVGDVSLAECELEDAYASASRTAVDASPCRCPLPTVSARMLAVLASTLADGDSVGGTVACIVRNAPMGLGEPCFDKLPALLAHAMMSLPAARGFEIGRGFAAAKMRGSTHNDAYVVRPDFAVGPKTLTTATNHAGGVVGGISNGCPIYFRVAFKPPASIARAQQTASYCGTPGVLELTGRHDPCVVARAVPIVEAMAALVMIDALLMQNTRNESIGHRREPFDLEMYPYAKPMSNQRTQNE